MNKISFCPLVSFASTTELLLGINSYLSITACKKLIKKFKLPTKNWKASQEILLPLSVINAGRISPHYSGRGFEIINEDSLFLALEKPVKAHSHPLGYDCQNNTFSYLLQQKKYSPVMLNTHHYDRSLLYRLDFETSGVLLLVKNEEALKTLRENFHQLVKKKSYQAIVRGNGDSILGRQQNFLMPAGPRGRRMKVTEGAGEGRRQALLTVLDCKYDRDKNLSLLNIQLQTGVRHQIRCQLASLGFPIIGDELYSGEKAPRLYLHAFSYEISFANKNYQFQAKKSLSLKSLIF